MIGLIAAIVGSLFDPLRIIAAIACGFIPKIEYALTCSIAASVALTFIAHNISRAEGLPFSGVYLIGAAISSTLITIAVFFIRQKLKSNQSNAQED